MSGIPVVWAKKPNLVYTTPDGTSFPIANRDYWDQGLLERLFAGQLWKPPGFPHFEHYGALETVPASVEGAIVVIPARWHVNEVEWINDSLNRFKWVLLILTGDEESSFPHILLRHPRMKVWVQTPKVGTEPDRKLGDYWPLKCPEILKDILRRNHNRPLNWFFAGQAFKGERQSCIEVLKSMQQSRNDGLAVHTPGFGAGLTYPLYLSRLAAAKVAPAPSGPFTPDTFRFFEALEAGCIPVVSDWQDYWIYLFDNDFPCPIIHQWNEFPELCDDLLKFWDVSSNVIQSWWQRKKREISWWLIDDLCWLMDASPEMIADDSEAVPVTVLITTSPSPFHPDTSVIRETIESIRNYEELSEAEIIILCDGIHPTLKHREEAYYQYIRELNRLCNFEWRNVVTFVFGEHRHQSLMIKEALNLVRTPYILFVEHDAPLVGPIDWSSIYGALQSGEVNLIRFHHESEVLEAHSHLMLDRDPVNICNVPLLRTIQWSQRPHIARTDFYRSILDQYFGPGDTTMIEEVMHSVVITNWRLHSWEGWHRFKTWMYAPPGNIKRSTHLDARGQDPHVPNFMSKWQGLNK